MSDPTSGMDKRKGPEKDGDSKIRIKIGPTRADAAVSRDAWRRLLLVEGIGSRKRGERRNLLSGGVGLKRKKW